jgi:heme/copper-type cytochrome/quinol oxidase subunit 3
VNDRQRVRAVGAWLLIGADALFWLTLLFIVGRVRGGTEGWPDVPPDALPSLPRFAACLLATGLAALLPRGRPAMLAVAAVFVILFWRAAYQVGLTPRVGRYGATLYVATALFGVHVAGALVAAALASLRGRKAPLLRRFLMFLPLAGLGIVGVFWL